MDAQDSPAQVNNDRPANQMVINIRNIKAQINDLLPKIQSKSLQKRSREILSDINDIEANIYQVKNQSPKDKIALPIKLNNRLSGLMGLLQLGDYAPPESYYQIYELLDKEMQIELDKMQEVRLEIEHFNQQLNINSLPLIE